MKEVKKMNEFERLILLIGQDNFNKLKDAKVLVFGCGGVGASCIEMLARSGVGLIGVVDNDKVEETNINRQLIAKHSTIGQYKVDVISERIKDINPNCEVIKYNMFYLPNNKDEIDINRYDYIIDCIDTISAKIAIIEKAYSLNKKIISSMGTANKTDYRKFKISPINQTSYCPLAKTMRYELKRRGISDVLVLYSTEEVSSNERLGTIATMPVMAGIMIADYVIKDIIK